MRAPAQWHKPGLQRLAVFALTEERVSCPDVPEPVEVNLRLDASGRLHLHRD
jgi:hypothetical protein